MPFIKGKGTGMDTTVTFEQWFAQEFGVDLCSYGERYKNSLGGSKTVTVLRRLWERNQRAEYLLRGAKQNFETRGEIAGRVIWWNGREWLKDTEDFLADGIANVPKKPEKIEPLLPNGGTLQVRHLPDDHLTALINRLSIWSDQVTAALNKLLEAQEKK